MRSSLLAGCLLSLTVPTGCAAASGGPAAPGRLAVPVGRPLPTGQTVRVGVVRGGIRQYPAHLSVVAGSRSVDRGSSRRVLRLDGIAAVRVGCTAQPRASLRLTSWARGEGPPAVSATRARVRGMTSLGSLVGSFGIPRGEARGQTLAEWRLDGGGEAFQFEASVAVLLTPTTSRCDVLVEATVVTTGAFARYAPAHRVW